MIDPNKTYRTRDGRPVRIYAVDGEAPRTVHGAWKSESGWCHDSWTPTGFRRGADSPEWADLFEVRLMQEIPWEALRQEINWVAMDSDGRWHGYASLPIMMDEDVNGGWGREGTVASLFCIQMPVVPENKWRETLCLRPGGR